MPSAPAATTSAIAPGPRWACRGDLEAVPVGLVDRGLEYPSGGKLGEILAGARG